MVVIENWDFSSGHFKFEMSIGSPNEDVDQSANIFSNNQSSVMGKK